ncbi:DUF6297 family protein [Flindersiella endophytica]
MATTTATAAIPSARRIQRELRTLRRGHSDQTWLQAIDQLYYWLFSIAMIGSMGGVVVHRAWGEIAVCETASCVDARDALPLPVGLAVLVLAVRTLLALGPIVASRASATWLLTTPVDRTGLLVKKLAALCLGGLVIGAGLLLSVATLGGGTASSVWLAASSGACLGLALVTAAVVAQPHPPVRRALKAICDVLLVLAIAMLPLFLLDAALASSRWMRPAPLLAVTAIAGVAAIPLLVRAITKLRAIPRREMETGGGLLTGLAGAATSMDTSLISDLLTSRRFRALGARTSRRGRGSGRAAIAIRETQRWLRSPYRIVIAAGLLVVPYAVSRIGVPSIVPITAAIAGYLGLRPFAGGLHTISRSDGLRRSLPYNDVPLRLALSAPMLAFAVLWSLAITPALPDHTPPVAGWIAMAAAISAGVLRSVTRQPIRFDGPLISTPAGALPAGFVAQLFRGPDFLLVGVALLALGVWWQLSVLLPFALLAFALWKGGARASAQRALDAANEAKRQAAVPKG